MTTTNENFFQKIEDEAVKIVDDIFGKAEGAIIPIEQSISKFGNAVVNGYKTLAANPEVATLAGWFVTIAEGIDPALTPIISGIELAFPKIVNIATGVLGEINKPVKEQLSDGLTAIENTKALNTTLGANILGGINAAVQAYVVTNNATSMAPVSDSQLIVAAHIVHAQVA
jgi:hypothetical protein